jgi:hypothetical protein
LLCLCVVPAVRAFDWPLEDAVVVAGFLENAGGRFGSGVAIVAPSQEVRPIAEGELVFYTDPGALFSSVPSGLGAFVVVEHAERVRSIYGHLEPGSLPGGEDRVTRETPLGRVGDSGLAVGPRLALQIIDMETEAFLNPLTVLPLRPDSTPPRIAAALLRRDDRPVDLADSPQLVPGPAEVLVEAYDVREDVPFQWRLAPHSLSVSVNGMEQARLTFISLLCDGRTLMEGGSGRPFEQVFADRWLYNLGPVELRTGETRIQLFARDVAGNESSREFLVSIREVRGSP